MPKVSVIMPAYNSAAFLPRALDSLLCQTCQDFDIIIVDDGSTDNTREIIEKYMLSEKSRIKYFYQNNQGASAARNRGISEARGELITFLDADDTVSTESLLLRQQFLDTHKDVAVVFSDYDVQNNNRLSQACLAQKGFLDLFKDAIFARNDDAVLFKRDFYKGHLEFSPRPMWTGTVMLRRDILPEIGHWKTNIDVGEDNDYWARIVSKHSVGFINKSLACYHHASSIVTDYSEKYYLTLLKVNRQYYTQHFSMKERKTKKIANAKTAQTYRELAYLCYKQGERKKAITYSLKSITYSPWRLEAYRIILGSIIAKQIPNPPARYLIVMDLDFKRFDSWVEFTLHFTKTCSEKGIRVEYLIPTEPCSAVKKKLQGINFQYAVYPHWWDKRNIHKRHNIKLALHTLKVIWQRKPKVLAFHFCMESTVFIIALGSILLGKPAIVWHQHDEINPLSRGFSFKRYFSKLRLLSLLIDKICPVYKGQENILLERGISPNSIATIYNGIDSARFKQPLDKDLFLKELGVNKKYALVCAIASLIPRKGLAYLLEAASIVVLANPETVFLIAGEGPLLDELKKLRAALKLNDNVFFLGRRLDIDKILSVSDIFALPSLAEPFGLVNLEAMAAGKPVVATKVGGIPEIVREGENGFLVPPCRPDKLAEAILALLNDKQLAQDMGHKGREIVESKFSLDAMVKHYLSVYGQALTKEKN